MDECGCYMIAPEVLGMCTYCQRMARLERSGKIMSDLMKQPGAPKPPAGREAPSREWLALVREADRIAGVAT